MEIINTTTEARQFIAAAKQASQTLAFVPTMGNLHAGHLQLVKEAKHIADVVVVSIFVNPSQFCKGEDFASYPSTFEDDAGMLRDVGANCLFFPDIQEIYSNNVENHTQVLVPELSAIHCGHYRPGHFQGVTTIVSKLFNILQPDIAVFGEKDFQQLRVIQQMVADLCMPIDIHSVPTVREADGLAMSSRNNYLNQTERVQARSIFLTLTQIANDIKAGHQDFEGLQLSGLMQLQEAKLKPQYLSICRQTDLQPATATDHNLVILTAAYAGTTRLIDNILTNLK